MADSPYPELKKSHVPERVGRPWTDYKPPPSAPVWAVISGFGSFHVLVAALELGVFDSLADRGATPGIPPAVTTPELAEELGVSVPHLEALLDSLAVLGLLERVGGRYGLNDTAARYLTSHGAASMAALVPVAPGPLDNWSRLADTIRAGRPAPADRRRPARFLPPLSGGHVHHHAPGRHPSRPPSALQRHDRPPSPRPRRRAVPRGPSPSSKPAQMPPQ